ncbi:MAG: hypothetical protein AAGI69_10520 [Cyanobacteria bacterium P01_H01_bin.21]
MVQAVDFKQMGFNEFIRWVPDDGKTYELHQGVVTETQPTGPHELVGRRIHR